MVCPKRAINPHFGMYFNLIQTFRIGAQFLGCNRLGGHMEIPAGAIFLLKAILK
jgi:hypothetical protein